MTTTVSNIRRTVLAAVGALFVSTFALSTAVLPSVAPLTAQPVL